MRVLIIRPEREATALATALAERGHTPVIAPLFRLEFLHPPAEFSAALASCQAVLLTSANGARALAEASEQRGRPILAVGDTTASTAEGLGFSAVTSASGDGAALTELVRERLRPADGPLLHVSGREVAADLGELLRPAGFEVKRLALYDAREETALPDSARAALEARALDVITFFSPRAASVFASMVEDAGLATNLHDVTAVAISPAALAPAAGLPFKAVVAAERPSRQAVLDEIDRLAEAPVQGQATMSDTSEPVPPPSAPPPAQTVIMRRGLGVVGAFVVGVLAAVIVLAGALISLPFWPQQARDMWRGHVAAIPPAPGIDLQAVRADASAVATAAVDAARKDLTARLDDLEKRLRAVSATAAERPAAAPGGPDPAVADLKSRVEALEQRPAASGAAPAPNNVEAEKEIAVLTREIAALRATLGALDQAVANQRDQAKALSDAVGARNSGEQKALVAARASAVIGVAARLAGSIDAGVPFASELNLLLPLVQGDGKLTEIIAALQPYAQTGVASRAALEAEFPAVAKAALAEDVADDSYGERLMGKLRGLVSLRRVGDVPGDTTEAKLARAEQALHAGDVGKAAELVKSLPASTSKATAAWLAKADAHLAAKRSLDQLAAYAVNLLGTAR
ncbi:Uroporphyrinogen-III synthase [Rhodospirillales bacterium URHD0017]|nr:Uroporphyrinogen-III synthase [Rhodospirillales bacterium URHD0017]